jgi:hypothetical protein
VNPWEVASAFGSVAAALVAAFAAWQSRKSAKEANIAAKILASIEEARRKGELRPHFTLTTSRPSSGSDVLNLRLTLVGPPELDSIDGLTISVRDDDYRRGETGLVLGGATEQDIKQQIWGPYRFRPGTGPYEARADEFGRSMMCAHALPVGEDLDFTLEATTSPRWSTWTPEQWATDRGSLIKVEIQARHQRFGPWTIRAAVEAAPLQG